MNTHEQNISHIFSSLEVGLDNGSGWAEHWHLPSQDEIQPDRFNRGTVVIGDETYAVSVFRSSDNLMEGILTQAVIEKTDEPAPGERKGAHPLMRHFAFAHLPPDLQAVSRHFQSAAFSLDSQLPPSAEKSAGMRKLLEAKDCFVRAALEARDVKP